MERLIIASQNKGKILEIQRILSELPFEIMSMKDAGFDLEIEEKGSTFRENALLKAQNLLQYTDGMVLADDSGLEIDFLKGAPGIYTARFAGKNASQEEKNTKIITLLNGVEEPYRTARFVCAIAFVSKQNSFTVEGEVRGSIAQKPEGDAGFGYDPIFYLPEYQMTFAQLPESIKNRISHRANALKQLRMELEKMHHQEALREQKTEV